MPAANGGGARWGPGTPYAAPLALSQTSSAKRPRWALPALVIGTACSLVVAWISADYGSYVAGGGSESVSMVYGLRSTLFLLVGGSLMLAGADATVRPWRHGRPWLRWAVAGAVLIWLLVVLTVPGEVAKAVA
jgi:hypothetical protein